MTAMTCQELEDLLGDWLAGELASGVLLILESHVGECSHCGEQAALYRATVAICRRLSLTPEPLSEAFAAKLRRMILVDEE